MFRLPAVLLAAALTPAFSEPTSFQLDEATIASIHAAIGAGKLTAAELVTMYLRRIEAYDQNGPALNAVILINPEVERRAAELDAKFAVSGFTGPLHGIPVLLKDNVETADMPTTAGSRSLEGFAPSDDAFLVKRLREAGALIIAKVNLTEFAATGITRSSILGQTLNPYDLTRTPGGSSGGTGAGLAANFGVVGIGTDTVNSIRSPSSANSLVGIRPTRGLVSRAGVVPYSHTQDMAGPLARSVADAAKVLEVIAGYDPEDPTTAWSRDKTPRFSSFLDSNGLKGTRLGVLASFFGTGPEHEEVNAVMETALQALRDAGAHLVTLEDPIDADELIRDVSVGLYELDPDLSAYLAERRAPVKSLSEILASGKYEPVLKNTYERALALDTNSREYRSRLLERHALRDRLMAIMADQRLDAVVYPHQKRLVVPIGEDQVDRNGVLASVTGFPAITVPAGFSPPTDSAPIGVPVGIEFLGRPWSEGELLRIAYAFEKATHFRRPPRSTPPLQGSN